MVLKKYKTTALNCEDRVRSDILTLKTSELLWKAFQDHVELNKTNFDRGMYELVKRAAFIEEVWMIEEDNAFYSIEEEITGEYVKFNSNSNFNESNDEFVCVFNTFSHYSLIHSNYTMLVCDIQG